MRVIHCLISFVARASFGFMILGVLRLSVVLRACHCVSLRRLCLFLCLDECVLQKKRSQASVCIFTVFVLLGLLNATLYMQKGVTSGMSPRDAYIREALELTRRMIILADEGEAHAQDDGCVVLFGVVRDSAYRIRREAEREREVHRRSESRPAAGLG